MPIAAGVERDGAIAALGTLVQVAAEGSGAASFDGSQHFQVLSGEPVAVLVDESLSGHTDQIGHLPARWSHLRVPLVLEMQSVQGAGSGTEMTSREVKVPRGFFQIVVPKQNLDGA
jgi:hypothetical protein